MSVLKIGVIGAGGIARAHLPAWKALGAQVNVYSEAGAEGLVQECGYGNVADTLEELLASCDTVDVVTPTYTHPQIVKQALAQGKDVICEKPLSLTVTQAQELTDFAKAQKRQLFVAHVVRYFPEYAALYDAVQAGKIGKVAIARFARIGSFPTWSDWFQDEELSGGVIMDLVVHDLDYARWLNGPVSQVYATVKREVDPEGNNFALAHVVLTHTNQAISEIDGIWGAPGTAFSTSFNVSGDAGTIHYDTRDSQSIQLDLGQTSGGGSLPDLSVVESPYLTEIRDFLSAIDKGTTPRVSADDAVEAIRLANAAVESAVTGQPVSVLVGE